MTLRTSLAILCLISFASCSVKEIRHGCPCILAIDLTDIPKENGNIMLFVDNATERYDCNINPMEEYSGIVRIAVDKGTNHIICAQGLTSARVYDGRNVIIPIGEESSPISLSTDDVECKGETQYYKPVLHKEWAKLTICYDLGNLTDYPYSFIIDGNVRGIDLRTGKSLYGNFSCVATESAATTQQNATGQSLCGKFSCVAKESAATTQQNATDQTLDNISCVAKASPDTKKEASVSLPRQDTKKPGLKLSLVSKEDYSVWKEYDLSQIIIDTGFDWAKTDLDDIRIHLDHSGLLSNITVIDWQTGIETSITI